LEIIKELYEEEFRVAQLPPVIEMTAEEIAEEKERERVHAEKIETERIEAVRVEKVKQAKLASDYLDKLRLE
jgi:creatinine amidohydrolase/Fe(II)-dependent formamide hydrolase-like protein